MFREMRRAAQQLPRDEAEAILTSGRTGVLGLVGDGGYPYTVPVNYVYADGKIYFHGAKAGHRFDAVKSCDKASFCVIERDDVSAEKLTAYYRSVIAFGRVRIMEDPDAVRRAATELGLKYGGTREQTDAEIGASLASLCCFEMTVEHLTGKEAIELSKARK